MNIQLAFNPVIGHVVADDLREFNAIADELAPLTRKAYEQQLRAIRTFYSANGWDLFNTDPVIFVKQVLSYLSTLADEGRSLSTINKVIAALRWEAGYTHPGHAGLLSARPVKAFLSGLARQRKSVKPRKAASFTVEQLTMLHTHLLCQRTIKSVRDRALLALGVATALRASNIGDLVIGDIRKAITIDGLVVSVRWSKTDQTGEGVDIPVARSKNRTLDPVRAIEQWVQLLAEIGFTDPETPLFPRVRGSRVVTGDPIRNPDIAITDLIRALVIDAGMADTEGAQRFSSHSLRATFITLSSQAGVTEASIASVSGHKSMKVLRAYDRSSVERHAQTDYLGG